MLSHLFSFCVFSSFRLSHSHFIISLVSTHFVSSVIFSLSFYPFLFLSYFSFTFIISSLILFLFHPLFSFCFSSSFLNSSIFFPLSLLVRFLLVLFHFLLFSAHFEFFSHPCSSCLFHIISSHFVSSFSCFF